MRARPILVSLAILAGACVEDRGLGLPGAPDASPAMGPAFLSPEAGAVLSGRVAVTVDPGDDADVAGVRVAVDGADLGGASEPPYRIDLDTTRLTDGVALLEAFVDRTDGSVATIEVGVWIDNDAPAVEILEPADGDVVYVEDGALRFTARVRDRAGVARVELRAAGTSVATFAPPAREELVAAVDVTTLAADLAPGSTVPLRLEVEVEDGAGHLTVTPLDVALGTRLLWRFDTLGRIETPPLALPDGGVAVGSFDGDLYVLDANGAERCRVESTEEVVGGPALSADGATIVWGTTRHLRAADAATCTARWTYATEGVFRGGPTVAPDGTIYAVEFAGTLHAVSPAGQRRWQVALDAEGIAAPAVAPDGSVLVGSLGGTMHAFAADGSALWTVATGGGIGAAALVTADGVYFGSYDFYVYATDLAGAPKWEYEFATDADIQCSPGLLPNGDIAVCSRDGNVYALDAATGEERWRHGTAGITYGGVAVAPDGTVVVGVADGSVQAVSAGGHARFRFDTHEAVVARPALSPAGDIVFVASTDRRLYALHAAP